MLGVATAGSGVSKCPVSGMSLSTGTRIRSTAPLWSDPDRHAIGDQPVVGGLWEGPACTDPVVGSVGHLQNCWFCCPPEGMMGSKGYWGTSVFF